MNYHHLALASGDMSTTYDFCENVTGLDLVKVDVAPVRSSGWAKHIGTNGPNGNHVEFCLTCSGSAEEAPFLALATLTEPVWTALEAGATGAQ